MKMKKQKIVGWIFVFIMIFCIACLAACANPDPKDDPDDLPDPPEFLSGYDISGVTLANDTGVGDIKYGENTFVAMKMTEGSYTIKYRISVPQGYDGNISLPVMLFFHGAGERGNNNTAQIQTYTGFQSLFTDVASPIRNSIIIAPQCPTGEVWMDYSNSEYSIDQKPETRPVSAVLKILKKIETQYNIDTDRIYSMGLSMGGFATWDLLVRHNDIFAAGIPICGGCDTSKAQLLLSTPIYTFHGNTDKTVSPVGTQTMYRLLTELGGKKITYVEYPSGHSIWNTAMQTKGLMTWLYSQKLSDRT